MSNAININDMLAGREARLPPEAMRLLQQAAQTPITRADPLARVKAIEKATERVKRQYPQFFKNGEGGACKKPWR